MHSELLYTKVFLQQGQGQCPLPTSLIFYTLALLCCLNTADPQANAKLTGGKCDCNNLVQISFIKCSFITFAQEKIVKSQGVQFSGQQGISLRGGLAPSPPAPATHGSPDPAQIDQMQIQLRKREVPGGRANIDVTCKLGMGLGQSACGTGIYGHTGYGTIDR